MDVERNCSHLALLVIVRGVGEPVGKRHRRIRARGATGQVAGAATEKPGLEAHRPNGLPNLRSPRKPLVPVDRT